MNFSSKTLMPLLSITLLFASCQKDIAIKEQLTAVNTATTNDATVTYEFSNCKIRRYYHHVYSDGQYSSGLFTYNKAGNPVSMLESNGTTGVPNWYFFYDEQDRLRELRVGYSPDDPLEGYQHRYGYDSNNRIIVDTTFDNFVEIQHISTLTYDGQGRIVKETIRDINPAVPVHNPTYTYDSRGNLGVNGWKSSAYDNKVSIFRTHPVFQFIFRNYSRNNAALQPKYNSLGLPFSMYPANDAFFNADPRSDDFDSGKGIFAVLYDCQ